MPYPTPSILDPNLWFLLMMLAICVLGWLLTRMSPEEAEHDTWVIWMFFGIIIIFGFKEVFVFVCSLWACFILEPLLRKMGWVKSADWVVENIKGRTEVAQRREKKAK
eukprot:gnl/MRDRNA2_/MRDRNA2_18654_c0_seq1.p1 gnl/MRDRNA2_/MRDRNA2_18654_c0~~gnl/MRDRNA2_/MRDRNA2_18654_c0_seq1.p1  ORF type:complete len:108 (-),score=10.93 gnl/MRDRNA2_/MRDRNA2_18654_c0_seq1:47-370(-)